MNLLRLFVEKSLNDKIQGVFLYDITYYYNAVILARRFKQNLPN